MTVRQLGTVIRVSIQAFIDIYKQEVVSDIISIHRNQCVMLYQYTGNSVWCHINKQETVHGVISIHWKQRVMSYQSIHREQYVMSYEYTGNSVWYHINTQETACDVITIHRKQCVISYQYTGNSCDVIKYQIATHRVTVLDVIKMSKNRKQCSQTGNRKHGFVWSRQIIKSLLR